MSRRIEIELTSKRNDEEWTWRAAGAKQPKGVLPASVLYPDAKVGDVSKAEADFEIEGITITAVFPPVARRQEKTAKIDVVGTTREFQGVTSQLVEKKKGRSDRPRRDDGERGDRRPSGSGRPGERGGAPGGRTGGRPGSERSGGPGGRGERPGGERSGRPTSGRSERPTSAQRSERPARPARPEAPQYKKLAPKDDHRKAVLEAVAPESRPIAEQVLRGGIPSVRQAVEAENAKAKAEGRPEINGPALIAIAEELLPQLKAAEWMDRAEAAKTQGKEISVRDLRAVVTGADAVARTDEARLLASELREALENRTNEDRDSWIAEIKTCLDEGRVVRALRLSARPPDAQVKFPQELLDRLKTSSEETMSPETAPDRWITLLDAVANSPVRRNVEPKGLPAEPGEALLSAAKQAAGRIPALAKLLGISMPPPPRRVPKPPAPARKPEAAEASASETTPAESTAPAEHAAPAPAETSSVPEPESVPETSTDAEPGEGETA